ncbi:Uncharacterised protein [Mycobacteroides abscessus subsp. abscessus]|nr:Uncharacterised protein [Mycobacteroides abscessus subsp. abscessus]
MKVRPHRPSLIRGCARVESIYRALSANNPLAMWVICTSLLPA